MSVAWNTLRRMVACPSCGTDNTEGAKFCHECGTRLIAISRAEERKVVTALFCDLVGFTATSESADPEDVDSMLSAYFAIARTAIEAFGGTVEKFIGDAVVGVFGVPAAHEDDPERAVRAGLRICDDAEPLEAVGGAPLRLRVGINTGEALVRLGISPASGEGFLAGDAINTASRIQSVAPEMGVAVGLATYEWTSQVFDYKELEPATLKGKSESVRVFQARSPLARLGTDLTRIHGAPYVGRQADLSTLEGMFERSVESDSVQFVTVVGEPGIGKSRIVAELHARARAREPRLTWRQGRCLPYGDGVTFWALGEVIKAHAGILETDGPDAARAKLGNAVPDGPDREWLRQRLLPLVGVDTTSSAEREELFAAWRTFLESVAKETPTVLVFEDIHWADEAMLAFLEHLAERAADVSLLLIATARPELFERHPTFAQGSNNGNRINLAPLSDAETAELVSSLLDANTIPEEIRISILERAEGNPLYVEEFLRLLKDQDLLHLEVDTWVLRAEAELPLPGSIQSLIAARLDTLPADRKRMLSDAAVVGKVFWAGAVAQMGGRTLDEVTAAMQELSRVELVRPARRSSMGGEVEYSFWHVLARDVAYGQLPRPDRAAKHVAAARWLEDKAGERVEDIADVLAHHYATALELDKAAGRTEEASELEAPALRFLSLAGERALYLDIATALVSFERALALTPAGHAERADALLRFGRAALGAGRLTEAEEALEEAIASFKDRGDLRAAAVAMGFLYGLLQAVGDPGQWAMPTEIVSLLEPLPATVALVDALGMIAGAEVLQGRLDGAILAADRALSLAQELRSPPPADAVRMRGLARAGLGDAGGLEDLREAIDLADQAMADATMIHNDLGVALWGYEGPVADLAEQRTGMALASARGRSLALEFLTAATLDPLVDMGELDRALEVASELAETSESASSLIPARAAQARILALRGQAEQVAEALDWLERTSRETADPQFVVAGLASSALARRGIIGQEWMSAKLLAEVAASPGNPANDWLYSALLPAMVRTAVELAESELAQRLVSGFEARFPYAEHSLVAAHAALIELGGDSGRAAETYADAADRWRRFGVVPEQAFALLGQGRCLLNLSRPTEGAAVLGHAREIFERLEAAPALAEADALLRRATALRG